MQGQVAFVTQWCVVVHPQSEFCGDKPKSGAKYGLPDSLAILSEMGEVTDGVMDNKVKYGDDVIQNSSRLSIIPDRKPPLVSADFLRWCIISQTTLTRSSPSIFRTNFLVQKLCKSKRLFFFASFHANHAEDLPVLIFSREGQPLKLPETKKTLLFTFNGDYSCLLLVDPTS